MQELLSLILFSLSYGPHFPIPWTRQSLNRAWSMLVIQVFCSAYLHFFFSRTNSLLSVGFCFCSCYYYKWITIFNLFYLSQDFCLLRASTTSQFLLTALFLCIYLLACPACCLSLNALHLISQKEFLVGLNAYPMSLYGRALVLVSLAGF